MDNKIDLVQGDSLNLKITFEENIDLVDQVIFSSGALKLIKQCEKIVQTYETYYLLKLTSEETSNFRCQYTSYDITVILLDGTIQTSIYKGDLNILHKGNKIYENN